MLLKWDYGFPASCASACIIYRIPWLSFPSFDERSTSLNDIGKTVNVALTLTLVALDGVMVLVVEVALK